MVVVVVDLLLEASLFSALILSVGCQELIFGKPAPHNLEHWLGCPDTLQVWLDIVGSTKPLALSTPSAFPGKSVTLARRTF